MLSIPPPIVGLGPLSSDGVSNPYMSYSLNFLKGGYIRDYKGLLRGLLGGETSAHVGFPRISTSLVGGGGADQGLRFRGLCWVPPFVEITI